jgi:hypothetical protein
MRTEHGWRIAAAHVSLMPASAREAPRIAEGAAAPVSGAS